MFEWVAHIRLKNNVKRMLKRRSVWTEEEVSTAKRILMNELDGVGRLVSTQERDGEYYIMMTRDLNINEELVMTDQSVLGH